MPGGFGNAKCGRGVCLPGRRNDDHQIYLFEFPVGAGQGIDPNKRCRPCVDNSSLPTPGCDTCAPVCEYCPIKADFADPVPCTAVP